MHQIGVERIVARDQHCERLLPGPPGPPGLLPHRRARTREAGEQHRIKAAHVDAQLKSIRRSQAENRATSQRALEQPTFFRQVTSLDTRLLARPGLATPHRATGGC